MITKPPFGKGMSLPEALEIEITQLLEVNTNHAGEIEMKAFIGGRKFEKAQLREQVEGIRKELRDTAKTHYHSVHGHGYYHTEKDLKSTISLLDTKKDD